MSPPMLPSLKVSAIHGSAVLDDARLSRWDACRGSSSVRRPTPFINAFSQAGLASHFGLQVVGIDEQLHPQIAIDLCLAVRLPPRRPIEQQEVLSRRG